MKSPEMAKISYVIDGGWKPGQTFPVMLACEQAL